MNIRHILSIIVCHFIALDCLAQHFVAKDGSGELRIIDGSRYEISFYSISGVDSDTEVSIYDTGYYRIKKDTIFLSSKMRSWADIATIYDTSELECWEAAQYLIQNLGINDQGEWFEHYKYLVGNVFHKGDTIILYCPMFLCRDCIISVFDNHLQRRVIPDEKLFRSYQQEKFYYVIIYPDKAGSIYLSDFPLLIRGKRLIPINENKRFECFVYNGFEFPVMDQKKRVMRKMGVMDRGKRGQELYKQGE